MSRFLLLMMLSCTLALGAAVAPTSASAKGRKKGARKAPATAVAKDDKKALTKPIKRVINAIRYGKYPIALKQFDGDAQFASLLRGKAAKFTPPQKSEFISSFHKIFAGLAFPRVRANFEKLETILYDKPVVSGNKATVGTTIVILHPAKKQEIKATFDMVKTGADWKVVDVTVKGDKSMLTNIRVEQIDTLHKEHGTAGLLSLMKKRIASLPKR